MGLCERNACEKLAKKNNKVLCYLGWDHFNFFEKTGIQSLCKVEGPRNVCKLHFKNQSDGLIHR